MPRKKSYYPVFLDLDQRPCLVVGGGAVAWRKIEGLLNCGAQITVVAPKFSAEIEDAAGAGEITIKRRLFREVDLEGKFLVYAATDACEVNAEIIKLSRKRGIFIAAVDKNWSHGDFITPARFSHSGVTVAVSSNGESCCRSRDLKNELQNFLNSR